tara:strand:+ start:1021 stop:1224 length:204 start_codon:yes stop_codon:yes gene_type:complete
MELISVLLFSSTMSFIGFVFGLSKNIKESEKEISDSFRKGYIDGYMDAVRRKGDDPYYKDFPKMGIN